MEANGGRQRKGIVIRKLRENTRKWETELVGFRPYCVYIC